MMLPHAYELPAAIVLVLAGALTCFAGHRLVRFVLAIWGFILGAGIASSMIGGDNALAMIVAGLVGGLLDLRPAAARQYGRSLVTRPGRSCLSFQLSAPR